MDFIEQIEKLEQLRTNGTLTDDEFKAAKEKLLGATAETTSAPPVSTAPTVSPAGMIFGVEEKTWCSLMHLSQLLYPSGVGIVVPIAMWIVGTDKSDLVRRHGHRMMNWIITSLIAAAIFLPLCFVGIGVPLMFILVLLSLVFPIMAAAKSTYNELWSYPLTFKFFTED